MTKIVAALSVGLFVFMLLFPSQLFKTKGVLSRFTEIKASSRTVNIENKVLNVLVKLARRLRKIFKMNVSKAQLMKIREKLDYANLGKLIAAEDFIYLKIVIMSICVLYFGIQYWVNQEPFSFFLMMIGAAIGYYVPDQWLSAKVKKRKFALRKSVPYVLSLFSILMEAGLNITQAMEEIAKSPTNELAVEIKKTTEEMQIGLTNTQAFENLALRTDVDEINYFVSAIVQGLEKGNSGIARVVKEHAENSWEVRKSLARELAEKASMKLFMPLLLLVFPAMVIFLLGPMIFSIMDIFSQGV